MESRSADVGERKRVKESDQPRVDVEEEPKKAAYTPKTVQTVVSLRRGIVNVIGAVTKQRYVFNGAGSEVSVDERDVPEILSKRSGRSCCGPGFTPYFSLKS